MDDLIYFPDITPEAGMDITLERRTVTQDETWPSETLARCRIVRVEERPVVTNLWNRQKKRSETFTEPGIFVTLLYQGQEYVRRAIPVNTLLLYRPGSLSRTVPGASPDEHPD